MPKFGYRKLSARAHIETLHPVGSSGFVCCATKQTGAWHHSHESPERARRQATLKEGRKGQYVSLQRFPTSCSDDLQPTINAVYVDLNFYRSPQLAVYTQAEFTEYAISLLEPYGLPIPSLIHQTHSGVQFTWLVHEAEVNEGEWGDVQAGLRALFERHDVPTVNQGIKGVISVAGSGNAPHDGTTQVLGCDKRYGFLQLQKLLEVTHNRIGKPSRQKRSQPGKLGTSKCLWTGILQEVEELIVLRRAQGCEPGLEEEYGFIIAVACSKIYNTPEQAFSQTIRALKKVGLPVINAEQKYAEVFKRSCESSLGVSPCRSQYRFKADTIIEKLKITPPEMVQANLRVLCNSEVKRESDKDRSQTRRLRNGAIPHGAYRERKLELGKQVYQYRDEQEWTWDEIAVCFPQTKRTLRRAYNFYKSRVS